MRLKIDFVSHQFLSTGGTTSSCDEDEDGECKGCPAETRPCYCNTGEDFSLLFKRPRRHPQMTSHSGK
jgi:hypothetical protein